MNTSPDVHTSMAFLSAVRNFAQEDPAVPHNLQHCPQWLYSVMPFSLKNKLNRIANGRDQDRSFLDRARDLGEAVPELAAVAHPPRATHDISAVWAASPPVAVMTAVFGTTWKIANWTGVIGQEARGDAHVDMARVKKGKKPAHSAAARLDSLELRTILDGNSTAEEDDVPMCAICQVEFEAEDIGYVFKGCNHPFHVKCMNNWLEKGNTCPCCRKQLQTAEKEPCAPTETASASAHADSNLLGPAVRAYMDAQAESVSPQEGLAVQAVEEEDLAFASEEEVAVNGGAYKSEEASVPLQRESSRGTPKHASLHAAGRSHGLEGEMVDTSFAAAVSHEPLHAATREAVSVAAAGATFLNVERDC
mmetsp:Transcript_3690/g.8905  ORF Transcript_3690/g.8905 Transcript_3690/m.8905 type:complete len:363 (-) Transcript_3690:184-1272(-)